MIKFLDNRSLQLKNILIKELKDNNLHIIPMALPTLPGNSIYKVIFQNNRKLLLKTYTEKHLLERSSTSLCLLRNHFIKCNNITASGSMPTGEYWALYDYLEGNNLSYYMKSSNFNHFINLFTDIGEELSKIHCSNSFDTFGDWTNDTTEIIGFNNYLEAFTLSLNRYYYEILKVNPPYSSLLLNYIEELRANSPILDNVKKSHIIHGDFHDNNIIINKENNQFTLIGFVDFDESRPGFIGSDFITLYQSYFINYPCLKEAFFKGYNNHIEINETLEKSINLKIALDAIGMCIYSYLQNPVSYFTNLDFANKFISAINFYK